jgi:dihydrolipoamide dehydrogenase
MPCCIWTDPQIAGVGLTEDEARARFSDVKTSKFPYLASGKAYLEGKTEGFVKIVGNLAGDIHGVEIMGEGACELISEAVLAKTMRINMKDWKRAVHGHPTISEILQEAIYSFCGTPIHSV